MVILKKMKLGKTKHILLTGPPGAGKGTQAKLLADKRALATFSVGQVLRTANDPRLNAIMNSGELLSAEDTVRLVVEHIKGYQTAVIIDGFPRQLDQAESFDALHEAGEVGDFVVLHLEITQAESWRRLANRGRADDNQTVWEERWRIYHAETIPAVERYRGGKLIEVDGDAPVEVVTGRLEEALFP